MSFAPINHKAVRSYILDRTASDNQLDLDLSFSDAEIAEAMTFAAREYNSLRPLVGSANPACLDGSTNMFLDAIVAGLYIGKMANMQRNDIDYTVGGVTVSIETRQITYMRESMPFHLNRFKEAAVARKRVLNANQGFAAL